MICLGILILDVLCTLFFCVIVSAALEEVFADSFPYWQRRQLLGRYTWFQRFLLRPVYEHHHRHYDDLVVVLIALLRLRMVAGISIPVLLYFSGIYPELAFAAVCGLVMILLAMDVPMWLFAIFMTEPVPGGRQWKFIRKDN